MDRNEGLIEAFASELISRRKEIGRSQEELAACAGINRTYIAKLELRKNQPSLSVMQALAEALECSLPDLLESVLERYQKFVERKAR